MKSVIKFIILNSIRDKIYLSIFIILAAIFGISIFFGQTSLVEKTETSLVYIAGASRNIIIFGMILFVCLTISKSFENKEFEFMISKSISRESFILAYILGFLTTLILIVFVFLIFFSIILKPNLFGFFIWSLSLICEAIIMIIFALLCSLIFKNSFLSILSSLGFYFISRMMGIFVLAINLPENLSGAKNHLLDSVLKIISIFFPRIDLFSQSSWLVYGVEDFYKIKIIFVQSLIYIPLLIFMAFHDFKKKEF